MKKINRLFSMLTVVICLSAIIWLSIPVPVSAYVDPSVVTYTIQAIAGIVIAVGAAVGIYFRKAKKKVQETLNIDENRNKEVESDEIVVDETASDETDKSE